MQLAIDVTAEARRVGLSLHKRDVRRYVIAAEELQQDPALVDEAEGIAALVEMCVKRNKERRKRKFRVERGVQPTKIGTLVDKILRC